MKMSRPLSEETADSLGRSSGVSAGESEFFDEGFLEDFGYVDFGLFGCVIDPAGQGHIAANSLFFDGAAVFGGVGIDV